MEGLKTKILNKLVASFALLVLAMCTIVPNISATGYSAAEIVTENLLLNPANDLGIKSADVSINTRQVTINCITQISVQESGAPLGAVGKFLAGVLGTYVSLVNAMPEVGDLLIVWKNRNQPTVVTFTCPKSWVIDLDTVDAADTLLYKVIMTAKIA